MRKAEWLNELGRVTGWVWAGVAGWKSVKFT